MGQRFFLNLITDSEKDGDPCSDQDRPERAAQEALQRGDIRFDPLPARDASQQGAEALRKNRRGRDGEQGNVARH
ncbi:MAG: hypothetical protein B6D40_00525 [Anaerolineae bacterium UTCFX3]|nr:MAG: hypothetical protein B6D40_00525 [Anaerolineae bacterium UTCFX3]